MPGSEKPENSQLLLPTPSYSLPSHHRSNPFFIIFPQAIIVCLGNMAMCRRPSCVWCQRDGFSYDKCRQSLTVQLSLAKPFTFLLFFNLQDIFRPGRFILPILHLHDHRPAFQDFYRMPLADGDVQGDAVGAWGEVE